MMPNEWRPEHKLFPCQAGVTCPPVGRGADPSDIQRIAPTGRQIGWHGAAFFGPRDDRQAGIRVLGDTDGPGAALNREGPDR